MQPRFVHYHVQSKWTRASDLGLYRGSVVGHVASSVDHDDLEAPATSDDAAACQAAASEVLSYFVRRMEL